MLSFSPVPRKPKGKLPSPPERNQASTFLSFSGKNKKGKADCAWILMTWGFSIPKAPFASISAFVMNFVKQCLLLISPLTEPKRCHQFHSVWTMDSNVLFTISRSHLFMSPRYYLCLLSLPRGIPISHIIKKNSPSLVRNKHKKLKNQLYGWPSADQILVNPSEIVESVS